jgi:hypothetical protein
VFRVAAFRLFIAAVGPPAVAAAAVEPEHPRVFLSRAQGTVRLVAGLSQRLPPPGIRRHPIPSLPATALGESSDHRGLAVF